jgi:signal recognition particle subunit SRP54
MSSPDGKIFASQPTRIVRVARGSGCFPQEVELLLTQFKTMGGPLKALIGKDGLLKGAPPAPQLWRAARGTEP